MCGDTLDSRLLEEHQYGQKQNENEEYSNWDLDGINNHDRYSTKNTRNGKSSGRKSPVYGEHTSAPLTVA